MGSFKLGKMTLRSLFKKPETVCYPLQTRPQPEGSKGTVHNDIETCILCSICARSCPTGALAVDRKGGTWAIDRFRCVQCGTCVRECPKHSLTMEPHMPAPATAKHVDTLHKPVAEPKPKAE